MLKFCSIVVTYNRKELLEKNIIAQLKQSLIPDNIIVIDNNSTDNTYEFLLKNNMYDGKVLYFNTGKNIGGAGGFNFGINKAYELGFDLFLLMDDDGRYLKYDSIEILYSYSKKYFDVPFLINSLVLRDNDNLTFSLGKHYPQSYTAFKNNNIKEVKNTVNPFNSTLLNKKLVDLIGYPNKDFFIKGDEIDYMRRAISNNAIVMTCCDSLYFHPSYEDDSNNSKVPFVKIYKQLEAPWKEYYKIRNSTYSKNGKNFNEYFKTILKTYLVKCDNPKLIRRFIKKGYNDGKNGILGITVLPGQNNI